MNSGPALILYITGKCFYSLEGIYIFLSLVSAWKIQKKLRWSCCCRQAYLLGFSTCSCLSKFQFSSLELLLISSCLVLLLLLLLLVFWEHWAALLLGTGRKDLTLETPNSVFDLLLLHSVVWWLLRGLASYKRGETNRFIGIAHWSCQSPLLCPWCLSKLAGVSPFQMVHLCGEKLPTDYCSLSTWFSWDLLPSITAFLNKCSHQGGRW